MAVFQPDSFIVADVVPSPNVDERADGRPPDMILLHYTGMQTGESALQRFRAAHVCVIGIGGVGSWAVEALARNAIGHLTLIDLDNIAESNVNRQLHALDTEFGKAKITAMAERIRHINPLCQVDGIEDFITVENTATMLSRGYDVVLDAIDDALKSIGQHRARLGASERRLEAAADTSDLRYESTARAYARLTATDVAATRSDWQQAQVQQYAAIAMFQHQQSSMQRLLSLFG